MATRRRVGSVRLRPPPLRTAAHAYNPKTADTSTMTATTNETEEVELPHEGDIIEIEPKSYPAKRDIEPTAIVTSVAGGSYYIEYYQGDKYGDTIVLTEDELRQNLADNGGKLGIFELPSMDDLPTA